MIERIKKALISFPVYDILLVTPIVLKIFGLIDWCPWWAAFAPLAMVLIWVLAVWLMIVFWGDK